MKNFKNIDGKILFECDAKECYHEDKIHTIACNKIMATVYTVVEDLAKGGDMRAETMQVVASMLWSTLYADNETEKSFTKAPFTKDFVNLRRMLAATEILERHQISDPQFIN